VAQPSSGSKGKNAIKWTRLSCYFFAANSARLRLHALAYNLANFMRTHALPEAVKHWSLTSLREKLVKIGAKIVTHARYATFQMAEVAMPSQLFGEILRLIDGLRPSPARPLRGGSNHAGRKRLLDRDYASWMRAFLAAISPARAAPSI
jgi:hypothetical protein